MSLRQAIARWSRHFTNLLRDAGVSKRLQAPSSRLGARAPAAASVSNLYEFGWIASSCVCVDVTMRRIACARHSPHIQPDLLVDVDLTSQTHFSSSCGSGVRQVRSATQTTGRRHVQHEDDPRQDSRNLGLGPNGFTTTHDVSSVFITSVC